MRRRIKLVSVILSVILFSSCATDRIQLARKVDPECKTPETRYDFGKKMPIREIRSNNYKYARNAYLSAWRNKQNDFSAQNPERKDKYPGLNTFRSEAVKEFTAEANRGFKKLTFFETMTKSSLTNMAYYELKELTVPEPAISKCPEVIMSISSKKSISINAPYGNESCNSLVLLKMTANDDSMKNTGQSDKTREKPFHGNLDFVLLMAFLAGLIPFAAIKATQRLANNVTFWAAMNPWKTRFMFAGAQIALGASGILLGERLAEGGMHFTDLSKDVILGTFLTSALLYPVRDASVRIFKHSYLKQRAFDLALALSGFLLMVSAGNTNPGLTADLRTIVHLNGNERQNVNLLNDQYQAQKSLTYFHDEKQSVDEQVIPQKQEMSTGMKILLTVLTVLAGLGLGYLLAAAACGLSCNGMEGLAYLVGIGGGILLIVLAVWVLKRIWNPKHRRKVKPSVVPDSVQTDGTLQI